MKKILSFLFLMLVSLTASANGRHGGYHGGSDNWVVPAIIGGVVGYAIAQPRQPQVIVQPPPPPVPVQGSCPYPYTPHYEVQYWTTDVYGRSIPVYAFVGCR